MLAYVEECGLALRRWGMRSWSRSSAVHHIERHVYGTEYEGSSHSLLADSPISKIAVSTTGSWRHREPSYLFTLGLRE